MQKLLSVSTRLAVSVWLAASTLPGASSAAPDLKLGTNLNEVNDYSPQIPFRDIFLFSREWITQCRAGTDPGCTNANAFDTGESAFIDLDADGWVKSVPAPSSPRLFTSVAAVWDLPAEFPAGKFIVRYEGSGVLEYALGASKDGAASAPGRDVIDVDVRNGPIVLRIAATNPANYIRNIRVVRPADEALFTSRRFTTQFLDQLRSYNAVRFMDWMRTNNSDVSAWSDRAKPTDARYSTARGVPPEVMIELANETGKTPWFTLPAKASDEYLQNFAVLVRNTLDSSLSVFIEYSNEVWNGAFSQGSYVEAQGVAEFAGSGESGYTKRMNWHGKRSAEMCDIWKGVFGGAASRVVCVVGAQAANTFTGDEALRCPLWSGGPCVAHGIDALAIAPYMGDYIGQEDNYAEVSGWPSTTGSGLPLIFKELSEGGALSSGPSGGALTQSLEWVDANKVLADTHGVSLVAYEGGQHLVGIGAAGSDDNLTTLFTAANRDPRMGALYAAYLAGWRARTSGVFMHFSDIGSYSRFGSWGALETIGQTSSPKYDALTLYSGGSVAAPPSTRRTLRVVVVGRGRVSTKARRINCGSKCTASIQFGKTVTLTAAPGRGFRLKRWRGACNHARLQCTFTVRRHRTVRAEFVLR